MKFPSIYTMLTKPSSFNMHSSLQLTAAHVTGSRRHGAPRHIMHGDAQGLTPRAYI